MGRLVTIGRNKNEMNGTKNNTKHTRWLVAAVAVLMALTLTLAGCGSSNTSNSTTTSSTKNPALANAVAGDGETLTVGTDATFAPMEFMDASNNFTGFDMDLMRAIGKDMGVNVKFVNIEWDALIAGLQTKSGQFDMAASAMTITPERQKNILFSDPYFVSVQALAVPKDSNIKSVKDLKKGDKVAVQNGTTGNIWATNNLKGTGVIVKPYTGGQDCFTAMAAGEVDAVIIDGPVAGNYTKQATYNAVNLGKIEGADTENYGLAFPKGSDTLAAAINKSLKNVIADGTYLKIYKQYIDDTNPPVMPQ